MPLLQTPIVYFLRGLLPAVLVPGLGLTAANHAFAQDTVRGSTAATIPHPELMPYGIQKGGFVFFPQVIYDFSYNDNVFGTDTDKQSSYIAELTPSIRANSIWGSHALNFEASSSFGKNYSYPSENYTDWNLSTDVELDIRHDIKLFSGLGFGHDHVERTAPDDSRGIEPTELDRTRFFTRYRQQFGRIVGLANLNIVKKAYDDVEALRFGIPVILDNSTRDRTEYLLRLRGGYQYVGDEQFFVSFAGYERDYDEKNGIGGLDRSSKGLEFNVGASFDYHGSLVGELSLGYRTQNYLDPLTDIETPVAEASIHWNFTDLTTVNFGLGQSIQESIDEYFSGYISTSAIVGLDHELRRNLVLNLTLQYTRDDYEGNGTADRNDKTYYYVVGSTYKMNRHFYFTAQYGYLQRKSDFSLSGIGSGEFDFTNNLISFMAQAQF